MRYSVWQLPLSNAHCFMPYKASRDVNLVDYVRVYEGEYPGDLELVYAQLNENHPSDYFARSLSTSDVIRLKNDDNKVEWFYVDMIGFQKFNVKTSR